MDSVYPCCPRSNLGFIHYVWDSCSHYFMKHAIAVGPGSPREKVMFLAHSRTCSACYEMFEGLYVVDLQCRGPARSPARRVDVVHPHLRPLRHKLCFISSMNFKNFVSIQTLLTTWIGTPGADGLDPVFPSTISVPS
jgi:hypothetical protein